MAAVLGSSLGVFLGVVVILFGGAAFLTGQALAQTWRPAWQIVPYGLLMAAAARFGAFAVFAAPLTSPVGYVVAAFVVTALMLAGYKLTLAHKMVTQYPWLYERSGLFGWRDRDGGA